MNTFSQIFLKKQNSYPAPSACAWRPRRGSRVRRRLGQGGSGGAQGPACGKKQPHVARNLNKNLTYICDPFRPNSVWLKNALWFSHLLILDFFQHEKIRGLMNTNSEWLEESDPDDPPTQPENGEGRTSFPPPKRRRL